MSETVIELDGWERKEQYLLFRGHDIPHFSLTAPVDVTRLKERARSEKISLFNAILFAIMNAANRIPEFRTRFRGETVVEHDIVHPSFTVPIADDQFAFCQADYVNDWPSFDTACRAAIDTAKKQTALKEEIEGEDQWIYLSCMPWLDFTAATHPLASKDDCIPRIAWGKIVEDKSGARVSINLQAHHALMDGWHAAKFYEELQKKLEEF